MSAVVEALEALGHPVGALPEPRLLAELFVRFQAQVPLRASAAAGPDELLAAWLEAGAGLCGEARVAAFAALASAAGLPLAPGSARHPDGVARRVLLAEGGRILLDPAFPLPSPLLLEAPAEGEATGYGTLSVRRETGVPAVYLETRGAERRLFSVEPGGAGGTNGAERGAPGLFRLLDDRLLRWSDGVLEVSDAWSRLRLPLPAADVDGLEAFFGPPVPALSEAPTDRGTAAEPTLAVYHAALSEAGSLAALVADPAAHEALLPEGWSVDALRPRDGGFERSLFEEGTLLRTERITLLPDGYTVEADGPLALFRTRTLRIEPCAAGSRLRLLATLRDPVPPRGLPEGTRRRLVFELASELLALDRFATEG